MVVTPNFRFFIQIILVNVVYNYKNLFSPKVRGSSAVVRYCSTLCALIWAECNCSLAKEWHFIKSFFSITTFFSLTRKNASKAFTFTYQSHFLRINCKKKNSNKMLFCVWYCDKVKTALLNLWPYYFCI